MNRQQAQLIWIHALESRLFRFWVEYYHLANDKRRDHPTSFNGCVEFLTLMIGLMKSVDVRNRNPHEVFDIWHYFSIQFGGAFRVKFSVPHCIESNEERDKMVSFLETMLIAMKGETNENSDS